MRTFVAIDVGDDTPPTREPDSVRPPTHMTLRFLGEVGEERQEAISAALRSATAPVVPFDFVLEGVGAFPTREAPRVVWVGATAGREALLRLARRVGDALAGLGFPPEGPEFVPHVTLFRVRSERDRRRARGLLDGSEAAPPAKSVHVGDVRLKSSTLGRSGPVHRTLGVFPLEGEGAERT